MRSFCILVKFKKCGKLSATLFSFLLFFNGTIMARALPEFYFPKDSLKNKYPLDDPRNSKCPCHLYQKKAEREYVKKIKRDFKNQKTKLSLYRFITLYRKNKFVVNKYSFKKHYSNYPMHKKIKVKKPHSKLGIKKVNNCSHF
jgi:hypothetical protein